MKVNVNVYIFRLYIYTYKFRNKLFIEIRIYIYIYIYIYYMDVVECSRALDNAKRMVVQCINGVGSNPIEGRTNK